MARRNSYTGKYKLSKHEYLKAYHYALCYNDWRLEYAALSDNMKAIRYSDMPHGNGPGDLTELYGQKRAELSEKMHNVESAALEADPDIGEFILYAAINEGVTFKYLQSEKHIPCSHNLYYDRRRKFYYLLNKKI